MLNLNLRIFPLLGLLLTACPYQGYDLPDLPPTNDSSDEPSNDVDNNGDADAAGGAPVDAAGNDANGGSPSDSGDEPSAGVEVEDAPEMSTITFSWTPGGVSWNRWHSPDTYAVREESYPAGHTMPENVVRVDLRVQCGLQGIPTFWVHGISPDNITATVEVERSEAESFIGCQIFWEFYCDDTNRTCWKNFRADPLREENYLFGQTSVIVDNGEPEGTSTIMYILGGPYTHMFSFTWGWFPNP